MPLLALAAARPEIARAALPQFVESTHWPLRLYAARAATVLRDQSVLEQLWRDSDEHVKEAANTGLIALGVRTEADPPADPQGPARATLNATELRDLSLLRARVTVRDLGSFEMALLPIEAPLTVSRIVSLAESGRYNGVMIRRVLPNVAAEAGRPIEDPDGSGRAYTRRSRTVAARPRRRRRQRRVRVLYRSGRQPAVRSSIHGLRAASERHGCRRRASRRRYHRESRHPEAVTFSARLPTERSSNRLTRAVQQARAEARPILDLTESNPTRAGFEYPSDLLAPLADARGLVYQPCPLGCARRPSGDLPRLRKTRDVCRR